MPRYQRYAGESRMSARRRISRNRSQDRVRSRATRMATGRRTARNNMSSRMSHTRRHVISSGSHRWSCPGATVTHDCVRIKRDNQGRI